MDLRVLVLTADTPLGELIKAQVDNLGCACATSTEYPATAAALDWADAVVVDLVEGLDDLHRLRRDAPTMRVVGVAPDEKVAASATAAGAYSVLMEPFSITDIIEHIRTLGRGADEAMVDLRNPAEPVSTADDKPWWATR